MYPISISGNLLCFWWPPDSTKFALVNNVLIPSLSFLRRQCYLNFYSDVIHLHRMSTGTSTIWPRNTAFVICQSATEPDPTHGTYGLPTPSVRVTNDATTLSEEKTRVGLYCLWICIESRVEIQISVVKHYYVEWVTTPKLNLNWQTRICWPWWSSSNMTGRGSHLSDQLHPSACKSLKRSGQSAYDTLKSCWVDL